MAMSDSKSPFRSILNIWGKPAENFAMLANRGQEIFVEASLRQEKEEESVLKGPRLLVVMPTLGRPWTAKVLATEALVGAAKASTRGACAGKSGGSSH
jgi:hypothetical protein